MRQRISLGRLQEVKRGFGVTGMGATLGSGVNGSAIGAEGCEFLFIGVNQGQGMFYHDTL